MYTRITVCAYYIILYIFGLAPRPLSREEGRMAITFAVSALTAFRIHTHMHMIISPVFGTVLYIICNIVILH